jgi:hypothetical protein
MQATRRREDTAQTHSWPRHSIGVSGQQHAPAELYHQRKDHGTHWIGRVGLTAGLETEAKRKSFAPAVDRTPEHRLNLCTEWD